MYTHIDEHSDRQLLVYVEIITRPSLFVSALVFVYFLFILMEAGSQYQCNQLLERLASEMCQVCVNACLLTVSAGVK